MKIEKGYQNYLQAVRRTQNEKTAESKQEVLPSKEEPTVKIELSEEAIKLSEATQTEVSARAQEIKKAVANGTYEVSTEEIAKGLLNAVRHQKGFSEE